MDPTSDTTRQGLDALRKLVDEHLAKAEREMVDAVIAVECHAAVTEVYGGHGRPHPAECSGYTKAEVARKAEYWALEHAKWRAAAAALDLVEEAQPREASSTRSTRV